MTPQEKVALAFKTAGVYLTLAYILDRQIQIKQHLGMNDAMVRFSKMLRDKMYEEAVTTWAAAKLVQKML